MSKYQVTLNSYCHYGYVEYDEETKKITVSIKDAPEAVKRVEEWLAVPQTIDVPGKNGIREFQTVTLKADESLDSFRTLLTRLWVNTDVRVEWSMPPGMADDL